jgi:hypothetical protein
MTHHIYRKYHKYRAVLPFPPWILKREARELHANL